MRRADEAAAFWIVGRFRSGGVVDLEAAAAVLDVPLDPQRLRVVLDTEHAEFAADPQAIDVAGSRVTFRRPGVVILGAR